MARAHFVKAARKDNPAVKKGESYYWWKFRYGGKHYSKEKPKRSQLTQSAFKAQMFDLEDEIEAVTADYSVRDGSSLEGERDQFVERLNEIRDEVEDALDQVPEQLQDTHMLNERRDSVEEMIDELESISFDDYDGPDVPKEEDGDGEIPEEFQTWMDEKVDEITSISYYGE